MKHHTYEAKIIAFVAQTYRRLVQVRTSRALFVALTMAFLPAAIFLSIRGFAPSAPWLLFFYLASSLLSSFIVKRSVRALLVAIPLHLLFIASLTAVLGPVSLGFLLAYLALWMLSLSPARKKAFASTRARS